MTQQATITMTMKRVMALLAVVMAALVAMSALSAPEAEAKEPKLNQVQCPDVTTGVCNGTPGNDLLIGSDAAQVMLGGEGKDIYDGKGGFTMFQDQNGQPDPVFDVYYDQSTKSSDTYKIPGNAFQEIEIFDGGGKKDVVDLTEDPGSIDYSFATFNFLKVSLDPDGKLNDLLIDRGSGRKVKVHDQFNDDGTPSANKIEKFKFIDGTRTLKELFS